MNSKSPEDRCITVINQTYISEITGQQETRAVCDHSKGHHNVANKRSCLIIINKDIQEIDGGFKEVHLQCACTQWTPPAGDIRPLKVVQSKKRPTKHKILRTNVR